MIGSFLLRKQVTRYLQLTNLVAVVATFGCSGTSPTASPNAVKTTKNDFISFLTEDGHVTPSHIERYLDQNGIAHTITQNRDTGVDRWTISGLGVWTANYTGLNERREGESFIIPAEIGPLLNSENELREKFLRSDFNMDVYYDSIRNSTGNAVIRFDRMKDQATLRKRHL